jgi:hypothetical protein
VETAVSKRAAQTLVEKQEQQSDLNAFGSEAVGVASAVRFEQAVAFELAQVGTYSVNALAEKSGLKLIFCGTRCG